MECLLKGPDSQNEDKRRMLVAPDGRPDVTPADPGDFQKRFLQKLLAGNDMKEEEYDGGEDRLPLLIPTRILNQDDEYIVP